MPVLSKQQTLAELRARIEGIERLKLAAPVADIETQDLFAVPSGTLHEVFADHLREASATLAFSLGLARQLHRPERPAVVYLQREGETQELGVPYGIGLLPFIDPAAFILCRVENPVELLWAAEEAVGCSAVAAVIVDVGAPFTALDFTALRRLSLRAADSGSSVLLLRYGAGREATAARYRWHVAPVLSGRGPFDARAPTQPRWRIILEKGRLGRDKGPVDLVVDWTDHGFERVDADAGAGELAAHAPLSGSHPAALGDRLSQAS